MNIYDLVVSDDCICGHTEHNHMGGGDLSGVPRSRCFICNCQTFFYKVVRNKPMKSFNTEQVTNINHWDFLTKKCLSIRDKKGPDYTVDNPDELHNFKTCSKELNITPEQALGVHLKKHMSAITSYIKNKKNKSEPIEERIADAINYLYFLYKMVKEEENAGETA